MLKEGRRAPGSEWLKNQPRLLERAYHITQAVFRKTYPALKRVCPNLAARMLRRAEEITKGYLFNCQMCGQCVLHSTGMTCPMTCPKNLRNGPCGGVRPDGRCEVIPELPCVWAQAWERNKRMTLYVNEMPIIQPPVNRALHNTASWINMFEGVDIISPKGWSLESGEQKTKDSAR